MLLAEKPIVDILPFSFERKRMTTVHKLNGDVYIYTKGAPRNILDVCSKILVDGKVEELTDENLMLVEVKNPRVRKRRTARHSCGLQETARKRVFQRAKKSRKT